MASQAIFRFDWDFITQQVDVVPPPVVIDDLNRLNRRCYAEIKEKILNSQRLLAIMGRPEKRQIAQLPDKQATKRHFYCGSCKRIPFPWARDPERQPSKEGVYLCVKGHAVCRTCYRMKPKCMFGVQDYVNIYGAEPSKEIAAKNFQPLMSSLGNWGALKICSGSRHQIISKLMTDAINNAEFACKNFYNWCEFRGRGKALKNHEKTCPLVDQKDKKKEFRLKIDKEEEPEPQEKNKVIGNVIDIFGSPEYHKDSSDWDEYNSDDDDDKDILNFDLQKTLEQVRMDLQKL